MGPRKYICNICFLSSHKPTPPRENVTDRARPAEAGRRDSRVRAVKFFLHLAAVGGQVRPLRCASPLDDPRGARRGAHSCAARGRPRSCSASTLPFRGGPGGTLRRDRPGRPAAEVLVAGVRVPDESVPLTFADDLTTNI